MRNRLWTELTQAKHNEEFASLYAERQRRAIRYFNIGVLVFSGSGIMGWPFWEALPLISCIIIAIISLLRLIQPHIIMDEKNISNLDKIHVFYVHYYNQIEALWFDYEKSKNVKAITSRFFEIKNTENEINQTINETIRSKPKSIIKRAKKYSDQYFYNVFEC